MKPEAELSLEDRILRALYPGPDRQSMTLSELAAELEIQPDLLVEELARMEAKGLLQAR